MLGAKFGIVGQNSVPDYSWLTIFLGKGEGGGGGVQRLIEISGIYACLTESG